MKFNISAEKFLDSLTKLNFVVPSSSHSTLPILSNIFCELNGNELNMVSTDLETFIKTVIEVDGSEDGAVAIPARKILDLVKALITKTDSVAASVDFNKDIYERISGDRGLSDVFIGKINYNVSENCLVYKGIFPAQDLEKVTAIHEENKKYIESSGVAELAADYMKFEQAIEKLFSAANKAFQKNAEKIKIKIESNDKNKVTVISKNGKYNFFGEPIDDYPQAEERTDLTKITISGATLRRFLQKVKHSVKFDEIRRNMSGVFFDIRKNELRFVATDGFRLSKILTTNFSHENSKDDNFIVPLKTCELLPRLLGDDKVIIEYDETMIKFTINNVQLYSKLIDDTFPNYETVIPKDNDKKLIVNRYELQAALRRALIFTDQVTKRVKFDVQENGLTIKADNPEIGGEGEETIPAEFKTFDGDELNEPFSIAFNVSYLLDCLTQIETDEVIFTFGSPSKASIALPFGNQPDEEFMELIMPVRVG